MNTAPAAPASVRAQGLGFATVLTLVMLLGINTLATQADDRAEAQMATAPMAAPVAAGPSLAG